MTKEIIPNELSEKIVEWTKKELINAQNLTNGWRQFSYFEGEPFKQCNGFVVLFRRELDKTFGDCLKIRLMTDVISKWDKNQIETGPGEYTMKFPLDDGLCSEEVGIIFIYMTRNKNSPVLVKKQITSQSIYDLFIKEVTEK